MPAVPPWRRLLALLVATAAALGSLLAFVAVATPAEAVSGSLPHNIAPVPGYSSSCEIAPNGPTCIAAGISALNRARHGLRLPSYRLPSNFGRYPAAEQLLMLIDQDRSVYHLQPVAGLNNTLDKAALAGLVRGQDPVGLARLDGAPMLRWGSNIAMGWVSPIYAYYDWMYSDGYGSNNIDCRTPASTGCWGHRENVLLATPAGSQLALGVAAGRGLYGRYTFTMVLEAVSARVAVPYRPTVHAMSRSAGPAGARAQVRLSGWGLSQASVVTVGGVRVPVYSRAAGTLVIGIPSGARGHRADVRVHGPSGISSGGTALWTWT